MNGREFFLQAIYFVIYVGLQMVFVRNLVVFDVAFCFVYVAFILLLPLETDTVLLLLLSLITGLLVDSFYDTAGIHAAACVLMGYLRPWVIRIITPRGGYDQNLRISLDYMGTEWFFSYSLILIVFHHLALFLIEASQWSLVPLALLKTLCSSVFTWIMLIIIQYLFYRRR
ncbi:Rod shape-determining protein MreD [Cytophagaceae bacterium YF14B1]|uniref:Rod shape-determining protein MreD n=1 Tax=Xanthocytophaga flava TaxID=3048013 RepID=A0AAE3U4V8_9BACT|nr:Rod shape-determining protein MreD [Xanthocytophaga flavus]MDJ1480089.1 Rod shape-determining protein MreD [Xanthocytophaga flavus]